MKKYLFFVSVLSIIFLTNCGAIDALVIDLKGNVTNDGEAVSGALVVLVNGTSLTDGFSLSNFGVSNSDGDYTIFKPDEGKYYVAAIDDVNDNLRYDEGIDRFGFHGVNPAELDITPKEITVKKVDLEGIDIVYLTSL